MLDFQKLKTDIPITQVLEMLNIKHLKEHNGKLRGTCPLCQVGNATAFLVNPSKGTWYCFAEKRGGDIIRLTALSGRCDDRAAAQRLAQHFNGAGKARDNVAPQQEVAERRKPQDFDPLKYLETLDAEHEALKDLDILPETLIAYQAGYASKGLNRGRLAVGWHDQRGDIQYFIGIALDGTVPRYLMPKGIPQPYFYGLHRVQEGEELRILPTILDVLRAYENGAENVICPVAPVEKLSLAALTAFVDEKKLALEF